MSIRYSVFSRYIMQNKTADMIHTDAPEYMRKAASNHGTVQKTIKTKRITFVESEKQEPSKQF